MSKKIISTSEAPQAIGPYSQAVVANGFVFCSGQIPLKSDGTLLEGGIVEQTHQVMNNLKAVLDEADSDFSKVVKTTIFLSSMDDYSEVNKVYSEYFTDQPPARATVEVARLPKEVGVEIEVIALV